MFTDYTVCAAVTPEGRLELDDRDAFSRVMRYFKRGRVTVRIEVDRGKRSTQANRYYRLILGIISDDTGDEPEYLHEFFKTRFMEPETFTVLGQEVSIWTTVKDADVFYDYVERIRRFVLTELGIVTPDPDPAMRGKSRHAKRKEAA